MKKKILLIIGALLILIPLNTEALTGNVSVSCNNTKLTANATTTCTIRGNINEEVTTVHAKIELGSNLSLVGVTPDSSWEGDGEGGVLDLYTDVNKKGTFNIATFQVKAGNVTTGANTNITLSEVTLSDAEFNETTFTVTPISIRIPSSINTLSALTIDGESVEGFSTNNKTYEITLDTNKNSINIGATRTDSNSTITGTGNKTVKYGTNTFTVTVTSETGIDNTYTLVVKREEVRELGTLLVNEEEIKLEKGTYEYQITVDNSITSVDIEATLENEGLSSFIENYGPRKIEELKVGNNEILLKVQDEYGEALDYKLIINRLDENGKDVSIENPSTGDMNIFVGGIVVIGLIIVGMISIKKIKRINAE